MSQSKSVESASVHSRILVPQRYNRQPVISRLVSRYGLTVNIKAASLTSDSDSDGWFDLELSGNPQKLTNSLSYLQGLGVNLLQLAIANQIQPNQHSLPFPKPASKLNLKDSTWLTNQWQEQFQQWISLGQTNRLRLQLCVLKSYYEEPVISELVSRYGLTVNITSAVLQPDTEDDGWFDLDLWGRTKQLYSSLSYLEKLGLPIWLDLSN
ncbi:MULTISPECIES: NIL domain-containing protein [unclassified Nostoc]|uniref:NIL domain-containing protein n=1 Tax=unclassified Nostoc TaxID=2593658 RepID=UPI002AD30BB3|nr:NIL domain-containing protein [Nostoc sp. DedQUE03]MDZ7974926.1 NIL domain-containing protein [Nostoc sp. DedQUE03]MDZ8048486.1 NIL domain-containing protein [Nostoc sp. DedQUE02]